MNGAIVHVFNSSVVSGPETLVLPALPRLGGDVSVVFLTETRREQEARGPVEYARGLGLNTIEVPMRGRIDTRAIRELREALARVSARVVHAHDVKASTYALRAARGMGSAKPALVSTHHGVRGRSGWRAKLYERYYSDWVLPGFDRVLAVCSSDAEILKRRGLGERVRVHLNGVDRPRVELARREEVSARLRREWALGARGIPDTAVVIGIIGRLAPEKRLDRALAIACALTREAHPRVDWRIISFGRGPAEFESELKAKTRELGLESRVHWMGYRAGVGSELAGLDLLLSLSDAEGLPINLVEAGWAATPVFATRVDGNLDLIPDESFGTLVDPSLGDDELARRLAALIDAPSIRQNQAAKLQARVAERFSGERWIEELKKVYEGVSERK